MEQVADGSKGCTQPQCVHLLFIAITNLFDSTQKAKEKEQPSKNWEDEK